MIMIRAFVFLINFISSNYVIFRCSSPQILSWALIWVTSIGLHHLPIWTNHPCRGFSSTNNHLFIWRTTNDPLGSYNNPCQWKTTRYGGIAPSAIAWACTKIFGVCTQVNIFPFVQNPLVDLHLQYSIQKCHLYINLADLPIHGWF